MIELIEIEPSLEFIIPVLKWLKDPESVSKEERETNYKAATSIATPSASTAAYAAHAAAVAARYADAACGAAATKEWVNKYFSKISITREEVESELFKGEEVEYNKEFFAGTKIKRESEEHSKYVQRLAFDAGYSWGDGSKDFRHTNADFLYFYGDKVMNFGHSLGKFKSKGKKEIFIPLPVEEADNTIAKLLLDNINAMLAVDEARMKGIIKGLPKSANDVVQNPKLSTDYLSESKDVQLGRASQYGTEGKGERSFQAVAEAFNALTGEKLSGSDICLVQMCLKIVRQNSDKSRLHDDSLLDAVSYTSLWAEELNNEIL